MAQIREGGGCPVLVSNPLPQEWITPNQPTINLVDTTATQTLTNKTLTSPTITGIGVTSGIISGSQFTAGTVDTSTLSANLNTDIKVLVLDATITSSATLAALTGFSWNLVAGATYVFDALVPITCTTTGGIALGFILTTATLTSIQVLGYVSTAADNATAVSVQSTTTTSATKFIATKTAAYTYARLQGSMVVNAAGTLALAASQETSASGGDVTVIKVGTYMSLLRTL